MLHETLEQKTFVIMGDSSTIQNAWPESFQLNYLPASAKVINYAVGGSKWSSDEKNQSGISVQWNNVKKVLGNKIPDIIIITTGGNCFPSEKIDYERTYQLCNHLAPIQIDVELGSAIEALRQITNEAPEADIYLISNFYANTQEYWARLVYRSQLNALCDYFSCHLIDLTRNSGIHGFLERENESRTFTTDGIHLYTQKGKERIARLVFAAIAVNYPAMFSAKKQRNTVQ